MDVSVVIVNWNTRALLADCLRSVLGQTSRYAIEVIVVDNGSEDGSQEAVRTEFPRVKLIENEANLGFDKANNIGIRTAKGRYVCVANSDIRVQQRSSVKYWPKHHNIGPVQFSCSSFQSSTF